MLGDDKKSAGADFEIWKALHTDLDARHALSKPLRSSWERSCGAEINYSEAVAERVSAQEFERIKRATKPIYTYAKSVIDPLMRKSRTDDFGIILFAPDGCLLFLNGDNKFLLWAKRNGIQAGDRWREMQIGTNVFSIGIGEEESTALKGENCFPRFLVERNYYFSPIKLESGECLGGLAVVTRAGPLEEHLTDLAAAIARAVELQTFWFGSFSEFIDISEGSSTLVLDQSNGENRILVMGKETFKILGIPQTEAFYKRLETLIDGLPANREFWDIVNHRKKAADTMVNLSVDGKIVTVNLGASIFQEEKFHMNGIALSLSSIKRINKLVSQYSGNRAHYSFEDVIGGSVAISEAVKRCKIAARSESNILLTGESGVGKEVFAQSIHNSSKRKNQPYVALNCGAFSKELIASELFGYESGAFTGAKKGGSIGKLELASGGTLFLDEIGDMPLDLQVLLLRVLEDKAFRKVGGNILIPMDARIIAATNRNLREKIEQGAFREDLFYRLGVIRIQIPPLRERRDDLRLLEDHFIRNICIRSGRPEVSFTEEAKLYLENYRWPGNVRELQNMLEGIINIHEETNIDLPMIRDYLEEGIKDAALELPAAWPEDSFYAEKRKMEQALRLFRNSRIKAADYLGMSRSTFYRRMKELGMDKKRTK